MAKVEIIIEDVVGNKVSSVSTPTCEQMARVITQHGGGSSAHGVAMHAMNVIRDAFYLKRRPPICPQCGQRRDQDEEKSVLHLPKPKRILT